MKTFKVTKEYTLIRRAAFYVEANNKVEARKISKDLEMSDDNCDCDSLDKDSEKIISVEED
jgi:hypothetical protein